jgi:sugar phosphate isomerase/epimerase
MISLSASWNSSKHASGRAVIDEIRSLGFSSVELGFALTEKKVEEILALHREGGFQVTSLHNMCPLPPEIDPKSPSPDTYSLASCDEAERSRAVDAAKKTVDYSVRFGASAVVIHAGKIDVQGRMRELAALVSENKEFVALRDLMIAEREKAKGEHLRNVIRSLEDLVAYSRKAGVRIGVENRYYYREIPIMSEFETLFEHFAPGELYYWHDVGHAEVFDRLGIYHHQALLSKFGGRLLGIHLHDIVEFLFNSNFESD